jgi:hypothetical protein
MPVRLMSEFRNQEAHGAQDNKDAIKVLIGLRLVVSARSKSLHKTVFATLIRLPAC